MIRPFSRLAVLLIAILLLLPSGRAAAHAGGTLQLANEAVGPYLISLWTLPEPLRAGEDLHVSLFLLTETGSDGTSQDFILDADVAVLATPAGGQNSQREPGLHIDPQDPFYYESDLRLDQDGAWDVTILVDGPDGAGEISFTVTVLPAANRFSWLYWLLAAVVLVGGAVGAARRRARGAAAA